MIGYTILQNDNVPEVLKNKPRWLACAIVAMTVLVITTSAVAAGAFIGYTYCYLEHGHGVSTGNLTSVANLQIVHMPFLQKTKEGKNNRTINSALSSVLVSRMLGIGHALLDEELSSLPWGVETPELMHPIL